MKMVGATDYEQFHRELSNVYVADIMEQLHGVVEAIHYVGYCKSALLAKKKNDGEGYQYHHSGSDRESNEVEGEEHMIETRKCPYFKCITFKPD